jgi:pimeloyl-ACP methyl ester carboxylesterase
MFIECKNTDIHKQYGEGVYKYPITFTSEKSAHCHDTITRHGILTINPNAKATLLICHGFMCDQRDVSFLRLLFKNYNTLTFDFRGHGDIPSDEPCTLGYNEYHDVIGAVNFVKSHPLLKDKPLCVYGFSMGAVSSLIAQSKDPSLFDVMVLDCPFESTDNLLDRGLDRITINFFGYEFPFPCASLLKRCAYHPYTQSLVKSVFKVAAQMDATQIKTHIHPVYPVKHAQKIYTPCLFIACKNDKTAPVYAVKKVFDNVKGPKRLWITNGRRHYDSIFHNPDKYFYKINRFIEKSLNDKLWKSRVRTKVICDPDEKGSVSL